MRRTVLPVIAAAGLALTACNSNDNETPPPDPSPVAPTTTAPPEPTDTAETQDLEPEPTTEEPDNDQPDEAEEPADAEFSTEEQRNPEYPSPVGTNGDLLFPTDVRVAGHDGYERVVFDFEGTGTPGWRVLYVEEAIADESNQEVDLDGTFVLRIGASGMGHPVTDGELDLDQVARGFYDVGQADLIQDVYVSGVFEGWTGALIGLDEQAPFRVFTLTEPTRLVVDIHTDDT